MSYNTPAQTAAAAVDSGAAKANLPIPSMIVGGFLAGAYIAFGGLLAIVASAGLKPEVWGGAATILTGLVFSLGLILVVIGGAELLTGNMALLPLALLQGRIGFGKLAINWGMVLLANLAGSLFVAYVLAYKTGVIGDLHAKAGTSAATNYTRLAAMSTGKALTETHLQIFLRAIGCNWLVCLGVWLALAAHDVAGKIMGIIFPITAFVALGFDHVVANMFFLPLAMFAHVPGITLSHVVWNLGLAFLGNMVGAGVFVAGAYWLYFLRDPRTRPAPAAAAPASAAPAAAGASGASAVTNRPERPGPRSA